jgi:hypothetical protein
MAKTCLVDIDHLGIDHFTLERLHDDRRISTLEPRLSGGRQDLALAYIGDAGDGYDVSDIQL